MIVNKTKKPEGGEDMSVILTKQDVGATIKELKNCIYWLDLAADFVPHNERAIRIIQQLTMLRSRFELLLKHGDLPDDLNAAPGKQEDPK